MSNRSTMAMRVTDLSTTIKFCVETLGFTLVDHLPYADIAHILDADNDLLLLAGPEVKDITQHLDAPRFVFKSGDTLKFTENDLEARRVMLVAKGSNDIQIKEEFLGDEA